VHKHLNVLLATPINSTVSTVITESFDLIRKPQSMLAEALNEIIPEIT